MTLRIRTPHDRLAFIVDLANHKTLVDSTDADLKTLRTKLSQFLAMTGEPDDFTPDDFGGFVPVPEWPRPWEFEKEDFIRLRERTIEHLNLAISPTEERMSRARDEASATDIALRIRAGTLVLGSTFDVTIFVLLMLLKSSPFTVARCPNWESRVCSRQFFVKEGKSVYCSPRCGNAYRVRKSLGKKRESQTKEDNNGRRRAKANQARHRNPGKAND